MPITAPIWTVASRRYFPNCLTVADKDIGTLLKSVGMTLVQTVGGAGGPLYGTFFMQAGTATANKMELDASRLVSCAGSRAERRGSARQGAVE